MTKMANIVTHIVYLSPDISSPTSVTNIDVTNYTMSPYRPYNRVKIKMIYRLYTVILFEDHFGTAAIEFFFVY